MDAAVATALALAVVHPQAGNLGGGGFAVVRFDNKVETLDFRETAPAGATPKCISTVGASQGLRRLGRAAGGRGAGLSGGSVSNSTKIWSIAVEGGGQPAIGLAREGFVVTRRLEQLWRIS